MRPIVRVAPSLVSVFLVTFLAAPPSFAFQSPLSDDSRSAGAYFLGQRHDGSFAHLLDKYVLSASRLQRPGPTSNRRSPFFTRHIALTARSILGASTPVSIARSKPDSTTRTPEEVRITVPVEILFTPSYGAVLFVPNRLHESLEFSFTPRESIGFAPRTSGKTFRLPHFSRRPGTVIPSSAQRRAQLLFAADDASLRPDSGATLTFEFPAAALFTSDTSVTVQFDPARWRSQSRSVDFDIATLR